MERSVLTSLAYGVFAGLFAFLVLVVVSEIVGPPFGPCFVLSSVISAGVSAFCGSRLAALTSYLPHEVMAALFTAGAFPAVTLIFMTVFVWPSLSGGHIFWGDDITEVYVFLFAPGLFAACLGTGLFVILCGAVRCGVKQRNGSAEQTGHGAVRLI